MACFASRAACLTGSQRAHIKPGRLRASRAHLWCGPVSVSLRRRRGRAADAGRQAGREAGRSTDRAEILGRYLFNIKASGPGQGLRPLRDPDAVEDDEGND